jgi:glycerol-3-phosphate dehydrogenase
VGDPAKVDTVVVGGGLLGAAVARELARRGLRVLVLEREDWGVGMAAEVELWGPRLLELEPGPAGALLAEARRLASLTHLARPVRFMLPQLAGDERWEERLERLAQLCHGSLLTGTEARRLERRLSPAVERAAMMEGSTVDPLRLAWCTVLDARRAGALASNHSWVEGVVREHGAVVGVRYRAPDGQRIDVQTRSVVNAAGAAAPAVAAMAGCRLEVRTIRRAAVVLAEDATCGVAATAADGRLVRLAPGPAATLLGPLEDDWYGDPDAVELLAGEAAGLWRSVVRVLPGLDREHALGAVAAARAIPPAWGTSPSRPAGFRVVDHQAEGAAGLISVVGADVADHQRAAERAADAVCHRLGVTPRSTTDPLPGAGPTDPARLAREHGLPLPVAERLVRRRGTEAAAALGGPTGLICRCLGVVEAELAYAVREEQVLTLDDASRRLGLGRGPCAAICLERAAEVVGRELGWSPAQRRQACREWLMRSWSRTAAALDSWGWARQELSLGLRRGWPWGRLAPGPRGR